MAERIRLEDYAEGTVSDAIHGMTTYDADALREDVQERVHQNADNACIYTHHCYQIINDYEREYPGEDMGETYTAEQWQEAMTACAYSVASAALSSMTAEILSDVDEKAEELVALLSEHGQSIDAADLAMSLQCPHGWAAHDSEEDGACLWVSRQLDGCNAIARDVGPFWLSYTWTPATAEADA